VTENGVFYLLKMATFEIPVFARFIVLSASLYQIQSTGWRKKVSHCQMITKSNYIVLKPVNEIRFICQIQVSIKHNNVIRWY